MLTSASLSNSSASSAIVRALLRMLREEDAQHPAVQAMAPTSEWFGHLAQSVNDVFWIYEPQRSRFIHVSAAYEREWMRSAAALYADPQEWLGPVHRDDRPRLQQAIDRLASGECYALEYQATTGCAQARWIWERTFAVPSPGGRLARIAGVSQDITARKQAELELLRTSHRKDELLAMVAHELRNPLAPIRAAAALLDRQHVDDPAVRKRAVSIIERQVDHLTRLIDDLLDVARIRHGKIQLRCEPVRLEDVIGAAVSANRAHVEKNRLQLRVQWSDSDPWVLGESVRLTQVFSNLLHNATKFSAADGVIEISVRPREGDKEVAVSVRDEGAGIAAESHRIGLRALRAGRAIHGARQPRAGDRTGGRAQPRRVAWRHRVRPNAGIGKGSEFVVTLPMTTAPLARGSAPIAANHRAGRRILLVDSNLDAAQSLQALLELDGHTVATAFGGQAALDQAARIRPEVVIVDIGLPDVSGYEVARRLRADTSLSAPLLVALTAYGREQVSQDVREAGFDYHLVKPADPARLMDLVWMTGDRQPNETPFRHVRP